MGKVKGLIGLLVVVGGFYAAFNLIPPYFHNQQLQEDLDDIARRYTYNQKSDDDVKEQVIKHAQSMDIPLKEDQVIISREGLSGLGITVHYRVHVNMIVRPVDLDFTANSRNKRI
jgi:hypothetical protein